MSADDVAQAFVAHFYSTLDSGNAAALGALYVSKIQKCAFKPS